MPNFESTRDEYFGRLSFQPTASLLIHGSYRDSEREDEPRRRRRLRGRRPRRWATRPRSRSAILEANWIDHQQQLRDLQVHRLREPDRLDPGQSARRSRRPSTAACGSTSPTSTSQGRLEVPILLAGQTAHNQFVHPVHPAVRVPRERRPAGRRLRRRRPARSTTTTSSARAGRSATTGCSARTSPTTSTSATSGTATRRTSIGTSNGWGNIQVLGGRAGVVTNGQPVFFRASPLQTGITGLPGGTPPVIHSEFESQNFEVNDTIRWNDWSFSVGRRGLQRRALRPGPARGRQPTPRASSSAPPASTRCTRSTSRIRSSRASALIWAYDRRRHRLRQLRPLPPGGELAAARGVVGPQQRGHSRSRLRRRRQPDRHPGAVVVHRQVLPGRPRPARHRRVPDRSARASSGRAGPGDSPPAIAARYNFWEDTNNNARLLANAPPGIPHELYIPNLAQLVIGLGPGSASTPTSSPSSTTRSPSTTRPRPRSSGARARPTSAAPTSGATTTATSTRTTPAATSSTTTPRPSSAPRTSPTASAASSGTRSTATSTATAATRSSSTATTGCPGTRASAPSPSTSRASRGRPGTSRSTAPSPAAPATRSASPSRPVRNESDDHYQLDLNYTQNFDLGDRFEISVAADVFNVFDKQTGYAIQPVVSNAAFGEPTEYFDPQRVRLTARLRF